MVDDSHMREQLIGFLLDALGDADRELVRQKLRESAQWREELAHLRQRLDPLDDEELACEPPANLADKTCQFVSSQDESCLPAEEDEVIGLSGCYSETSRCPGNWSVADLTMVGGVCVAAALLFFPAVSKSHFRAQLLSCQNNLRSIGLAAARYSDHHHGMYPYIPNDPQQAFAGSFAMRLFRDGYITDLGVFQCSHQSPPKVEIYAQRKDIREDGTRPTNSIIPLLVVIRVAGDYGYNVGYVENNNYRIVMNRGRIHYAMVADRASATKHGIRSRNHGMRGQNVCFEDGHVVFTTNFNVTDNVYLNDLGKVAPGVRKDDAVLMAPLARPAFIIPAWVHRERSPSNAFPGQSAPRLHNSSVMPMDLATPNTL